MIPIIPDLSSPFIQVNPKRPWPKALEQAKIVVIAIDRRTDPKI